MTDPIVPREECIKTVDSITITLEWADFDSACKQAWETARAMIGLDQDGQTFDLTEWDRSCCEIQLEHISTRINGGYTGVSFTYHFTYWVTKYHD